MASEDAAYEADVVVIGAGLSGLSAAQVLQEKGQRVLVLEARDRVGGRTCTVKGDKTGPLDLGGAYVGPTQNRLLRLARKYGVKTYLTNEVEDLVLYRNMVCQHIGSPFALRLINCILKIKNKSIRFVGEGNMPPTRSLFAWLDLNNIIRLMNDMAKEIPVDAPWKAPHAEQWDKMTVQQFFDQHIWTRTAMQHAQNIVHINVTSEPYEVSLLWFLWYLASAGGPLRINATTNGGQERKFVGGSQQISEGLAGSIGKDKIMFNHPVRHIHQDSKGVLITDAHGNEFKASYCVVALAPTLQTRITWSPPLPATRAQMLQRLPMGSVIKTFMYYSTPFWRQKGMCGSAEIVDEEALVSHCLDHVQPDGTYPAIMGFVVANVARNSCSSMTKEERKEHISRMYAKVFNSKEGLHPVHYEEKNWCEDEWSGGCYTVMMPPGFLTTFGRELRQPVGRIHFAGTETATQWTGYMEGAIQAGERAAREILHLEGLVPASAIWQNEPEDQEVRARPLEFTFLERIAPSVPSFLRKMFVVTLLSSGLLWKLCRHRFLRG